MVSSEKLGHGAEVEYLFGRRLRSVDRGSVGGRHWELFLRGAGWHPSCSEPVASEPVAGCRDSEPRSELFILSHRASLAHRRVEPAMGLLNIHPVTLQCTGGKSFSHRWLVGSKQIAKLAMLTFTAS